MSLRFGPRAKAARPRFRAVPYQDKRDPTRLIAERGRKSIKRAIVEALRLFRATLPLEAMGAKIAARDLAGAADLVNIATLQHDLKAAFAAIAAVYKAAGDHGAGEVTYGLDKARQRVRVRKFDPDEPRDAQGRWTSGLSGDQKSAFRKYMGEDYQDINSALRAGKKPSGRYGDIVKQIDAALKRASLDKDTILYRGLSREGVAALSGKLGIGSVIKDLGFVSTSTNENVAKFVKMFAQQTSDNIIMRISAAAGTRAADISSLADDPGERETLLGRGTSFLVNGWDASTRTLDLSVI